MNNDLISREALKKKLKSESYWTYTQEYGDAIPVGWVMSAIDNAPAVNPSLNLDNITEEDIEKFIVIMQRANSKGLLAINEERPQGEWIYNQYDANPKIGNWHCSICHTICYEMKLAHDNFNYCPNCGADMRGTT